MYQYKGKLKSTKEVIAEGHSIEEIEKLILHFKRGQKKKKHTDGNVPIEIYHVQINHVTGKYKDKLIKVV